MIRRPPRSTRTDTLFPYTTLFRSTIPLLIVSASVISKMPAHTLIIDLASKPGGTDFRYAEKRGIKALLAPGRSEEHTSELQSLMRISYAVFCLKKKK